MKIVETLVREGSVRLLYANASTKDEATEWIEIQMNATGDDNRRLGVIQQAALDRVRELIESENERFAALSDATRGRLR